MVLSSTQGSSANTKHHMVRSSTRASVRNKHLFCSVRTTDPQQPTSFLRCAVRPRDPPLAPNVLFVPWIPLAFSPTQGTSAPGQAPCGAALDAGILSKHQTLCGAQCGPEIPSKNSMIRRSVLVTGASNPIVVSWTSACNK